MTDEQLREFRHTANERQTHYEATVGENMRRARVMLVEAQRLREGSTDASETRA